MEFVKVALLVMLAAAVVVPVAVATTYTVGNDSGWKIPNSKDFYSKWASKYTFVVGDSIEFVSMDGTQHTVGTVDNKTYDSCDKSMLNNFEYVPTTTIFLEERVFNFICTLNNHCNLGMKFSVVVMPVGTPTAGTPPTTKIGAPTTIQTPALVGSLLLALGLFHFSH